MAHTMQTLTKVEWDAIAARDKHATDQAKKLATKQAEEVNKASPTPSQYPIIKL